MYDVARVETGNPPAGSRTCTRRDVAYIHHTFAKGYVPGIGADPVFFSWVESVKNGANLPLIGMYIRQKKLCFRELDSLTRVSGPR